MAVTSLPPEEPREVQASASYDQAIRAETLRKWREARSLAEQVLQLSPAGRYEPATRRLLARLALEETAVDGAARAARYAGRSSPLEGKARFVVSATLQGLIAGLLVGAAASQNSENSGTAIAGGGLVGVALGLVPSLLAPGVSDPAFEAHLTLGGFAGAGITGALLGIAQSVDSGSAEAALAAGIVVGALAGVVVAANTDVTEGDGEAGTALLLHGAAEVLLLLAAVTSATGADVSSPVASAVGLVAGTAGLIAGELANRDLHWSDLRWALITTGGFVGLGVGLLLEVLLTNGNSSGSFGGGDNAQSTALELSAAMGELVGLAATIWGTSGLAPEAPRGVDPATAAPPVAAPSASAAPSTRVPRVVGFSVPLLRF
jgi:hypothetical protein